MYRVICDGLTLYDLRDELLVLNAPKVTLKENSAGSFSFTILPNHPQYDNIKKMKSIIQVYDNDDEIFHGRVIDETKDFYNRKKIECEGELAYLNDSVQRPAVYHDITIRGYLQKLLDIHNAQVSEVNVGIKFNSQCAGESASYDYLYIYYVKGGKTYSSQKYKADSVAGKTIVIPATEFYIYWHTDNSVNNYYGIKVDSVEITDAVAITGSTASLPKYTATEVSDPSAIESKHNPYDNGSNLLWHYVQTIPEDHQTEKMFAVGSVTVTDSNDSIYKCTNWESTMEVIKTDLLDSFGGHLRIRKVGGIKYLDYLADYPNKNTQIIQFGENLLDFTSNIDMTDIATAIIPLGAKQEESSVEGLEERLTVKSVNDGSDFVYSESAVDTYGWIFKTVTWDDVNVPANLLTKGKKYLSEIQFEDVTLTVKAVDLHMLNVDTERIKMLDEVRVISSPNGLDKYFPVTQMTINLDSPSSNTITLGQTVSSGMTGTASSNNTSIMKKIEEVPSESNILKEAQENASALIKSSLNGFVVTKPDEILIMDTDDVETATKLWRWNVNGLGYSANGYDGDYISAMTMDGQIVGERLVGGSVDAEKLSVTYRSSVEKQITEAQENAESSTDEKLKSYWTQVQVETAIKNTSDSILLSAKETAIAYTDTKLKSYSTSAQIKITTDAITSEVSKKLNSSELSTKIQQSASAVKIAWNNISKYIQFESGEIRIYDSANTKTQKLRTVFSESGEHFYRDGYYVGKIGTNQWSTNNNWKGLVFDLDVNGKYMAFAQKAKSTDTSYTTMLCFSRANTAYTNYGLHLGCNLYGHGNTINGVTMSNLNAKYSGTLYSTYTGAISIIQTLSGSNGNISWTYSKLRVSNGLIVGYWN